MSLLGQSAPEFTLYDTKRVAHTLSSYRGKKVVLAFFPAAFTGVCEKELCTFRDALADLNDLNATVFGISTDSPFANAAFAAKNDLNFPVLSDYNKTAIAAYDVVFENLAGLPGFNVAKRSVFIVDENGTISYAWVGPNPGVEPDYAAVKAALA
jgi:peroxiredoxin